MECMQQSKAWDGMLARMGHELAAPATDESASIASTAHRFTEWMDTPAIAASIRTSSFNPAALRRGRMSVYVILEPHRKDAQKGWLRMVVGTLLSAAMKGGLER